MADECARLLALLPAAIAGGETGPGSVYAVQLATLHAALEALQAEAALAALADPAALVADNTELRQVCFRRHSTATWPPAHASPPTTGITRGELAVRGES